MQPDNPLQAGIEPLQEVEFFRHHPQRFDDYVSGTEGDNLSFDRIVVDDLHRLCRNTAGVQLVDNKSH